jgi:hypothetical protein
LLLAYGIDMERISQGNHLTGFVMDDALSRHGSNSSTRVLCAWQQQDDQFLKSRLLLPYKIIFKYKKIVVSKDKIISFSLL